MVNYNEVKVHCYAFKIRCSCFQVIQSLSESSHVDETRRQELVSIYENTVEYAENIEKMEDPIVDELKKIFPGFVQDLNDHKLKAAETTAPVFVLGLYFITKTCPCNM